MGDRHGDTLYVGAPVLIYDASPGRVEKVFPRGRRYIVLVVSDVNGVPTLERIEVRGDHLTFSRTGSGSPNCGSNFDQSMVRASSRGGVPVFRRAQPRSRPRI